MKKIILTFDDGFASQHKIARPILKKLKLTATFYICGAFIEHPHLIGTFMNWEQVKDLSNDGFEIGSHLYRHFGMTDPDINHFANIRKLEARFKEFKIPKPTTLGYPGYHVDAKAIKIVRSAGYKFARAGCERTSSFMDFQHGGKGSHYNYLYDNPLNINCTGIFGDNFGAEDFKESLKTIEPGEIPVFCFHSFTGRGIPGQPETDISKKTFQECMEFIASGPFQTIKMCDIEA
jgi:peptidoglycan/xylan/chitin deacetylase (PgdA/CDA1 family)